MSYENKLKSWIPLHFREGSYEPYVRMAGEVLDDLQKKIDDTFDETFISQSNSEFLPIHASERGISRVSYGTPPAPETLDHFRNRTRRIKYNRTSENIITNLESISPITSARVVWDYPDGVVQTTGDKRSDTLAALYPPANWGNFGPLDFKKRMNCFSVVIEFPVPPPLSHLDDREFFDDQAFFDTRDRTFDENTALAVKDLIARKAPAGSGFRLLVKGFNGLTIGDEQAQQNELNSF